MNYTRDEILEWVSDNLEPDDVIRLLELTTDDILELLEAEVSEQLEVFDTVMSSCEET